MYCKKSSNKLSKLLVILSFIVLFTGVVIGVGDTDGNFDFSPFGIAFVIINGVNIVFKIIQLLRNNSESR